MTLGDLAAHRSGLPTMTPPMLVNILLQWQFGANRVAGITEQQIIEGAKGLELTKPLAYEYSNLGAALTGFALARAEGTSWTELIDDSVLQPLGLQSTTFASTPADIPPMPSGYKANGRPGSRSCCNVQIPAGSGTMSSAADLATYAQAMLDPDNAAQAAMTPRETAGEARIGLFWHVSEIDGREITWHDGGSDAFRTMLALDREAGIAILVMGNTDRDVAQLAFGLLTGKPVPPLATPVAGLVLLGISVLLASTQLVRFWRARQRQPVVAALLWMTAFVLLARTFGPWQLVPGWTWAALVGASAAATALALSSAREVPPPRSLVRRVYRGVDATVAALTLAIGLLLTLPWARLP